MGEDGCEQRGRLNELIELSNIRLCGKALGEDDE